MTRQNFLGHTADIQRFCLWGTEAPRPAYVWIRVNLRREFEGAESERTVVYRDRNEIRTRKPASSTLL